MLANSKQLIPFQQKAYASCSNFLLSDEKTDSGLAVLPTGSGKSVLLAKLSLEFKTRPLLFVVPSVELLKQNKHAIENEGGIVSVYSGSLDKKQVSGLTLATVDSLKDVAEFKKMSVRDIIVDEAHFKYSENGKFGDFIRALKPRRLLGLTASPFKTGAFRGYMCLNFLDRLRPRLFKKIIHVTQVSEVIEAGRWSPLKYRLYRFDPSRLKQNSSGTDFSQESVNKELILQGTRKNLCKEIKNLLDTKKSHDKILVFADSVDTANIISGWINGLGKCKSAVISSDTAKSHRAEIVEEYKKLDSGTDILVNYGTLTVGFDCSLISYVLVGRPIFTFSTWYQMVGRGVRPDEKKQFCTIMDFCGNHKRFGSIEDISIEFIPNYGWACFVGDKLVSGVPLMLDKTVTRAQLIDPPKPAFIKDDTIMEFGKYAGKEVRYLPKNYRDFLLEQNVPDITTKKGAELQVLLLKLKENDFNKLFS